MSDDRVLILQFTLAEDPISGEPQWQAWRWQFGRSILYTPDEAGSRLMPTDNRKVYVVRIDRFLHIRPDGGFRHLSVDLEEEVSLENLELEFKLQPRHDWHGQQWQATRVFSGITFQFIPDDRQSDQPTEGDCHWVDCYVSKIVHQSPDGRFCIASVMRAKAPAVKLIGWRSGRRRYARRNSPPAPDSRQMMSI